MAETNPRFVGYFFELDTIVVGMQVVLRGYNTIRLIVTEINFVYPDDQTKDYLVVMVSVAWMDAQNRPCSATYPKKCLLGI